MAHGVLVCGLGATLAAECTRRGGGRAARYRSPADYLQYWRRYYGPTLKAFEAVGDEGRAALEADLLDLIASFNQATDGTMVVPTEYLEAVIVRL